MKKLLFLLSLSFILGACSSELQETPKSPTNSNVSKNAHRVSLASALDNADKIFDVIDTSVKTRNNREIAELRYAIAPMTRTSQEHRIDTIAYIVNYADNRGFAIIGADDRITPVLAISNEGRFDFNDTIKNKPLAEWVRNALSPISMRLTRPDVRAGGIDNPEPPHFGTRVIDTITYIRPWINPYVRQWSQNSRFNIYCDRMGYDLYCAVGCAPLAAAQIMSFYEWPAQYNRPINWSLIKNWDIDSPQGNCPDILAWFLHEVGVAFNADYGLIETSCTDTDIQNGMAQLHYQALSPSHDYYTNTNLALTELGNAPLLVTAITSGGGHCWVMDGYLSFIEHWEAIANPSHSLYHSLVHFVWGWGGDSNGYFDIGNGPSFGYIGPQQFDEDDTYDNTVLSNGYTSFKFYDEFRPIR